MVSVMASLPLSCGVIFSLVPIVLALHRGEGVDAAVAAASRLPPAVGVLAGEEGHFLAALQR